jgi:hypothetical protein
VAEISATEVAEVHEGRIAVLTHALTGLLISDIAIAAAGLIVPLFDRNDALFQLEIDLRPVVVLWRVAFAVTVVVFLIWFYRARVSAERSDWPQRRARGWAFWGWVVPIADLWIPFQIMRDIWQASLPSSRRDNFPWLPAVWWASWLLTGLLSQSWNTARSDNVGYGLLLPASWISFSFLAIAGMSLVVISQTVIRQPR